MTVGLPGLSTRELGRLCLYLDTVDSTNDYLKERGAGLNHGTALIAAAQTAGKGRMGRSWSSPKGESLLLSVLLKNECGNLSTLPLVVGLAVCRALSGLSHSPCGIKWSNDVLCGDNKVCGILCESRTSSDGAFAVAGIGVNLRQTPEKLGESGLLYATSLFSDTKKDFDPYKVAAVILNELEPLLGQNFAGLLGQYKQRCVTLGRDVRVLQGGGELTAKAVDIALDGALVCIGQDGEAFTVHAGEASVRGLYGYV